MFRVISSIRNNLSSGIGARITTRSLERIRNPRISIVRARRTKRRKETRTWI